MKIGIIRCDEQSDRCAGYNCFSAVLNKTGQFKEYGDIELVGFDDCGGCGRGRLIRLWPELFASGKRVLRLFI